VDVKKRARYKSKLNKSFMKVSKILLFEIPHSACEVLQHAAHTNRYRYNFTAKYPKKEGKKYRRIFQIF